jgi:hypothetical protein
METPLKARANRAKSGSVNFSRRLSRRTAIKKSERKARRSFDTAIEYGTGAIMATEKTRTCQPTGGPRYVLSIVEGIFSAFVPSKCGQHRCPGLSVDDL